MVNHTNPIRLTLQKSYLENHKKSQSLKKGKSQSQSLKWGKSTAKMLQRGKEKAANPPPHHKFRRLRVSCDDSAVFVFLVAESEEALVRKTETTKALLMRVASPREELRHLKEFDYVAVNKEGELERSVEVLESIIEAEKAKVRQRMAVI